MGGPASVRDSLHRPGQLETLVPAQHGGGNGVPYPVSAEQTTDKFALRGLRPNSVHGHQDIVLLKSGLVRRGVFAIEAHMLRPQRHGGWFQVQRHTLSRGQILQ